MAQETEDGDAFGPCEWETSDGPCPNQGPYLVTIQASDPKTDRVIAIMMQERRTCPWHLEHEVLPPGDVTGVSVALGYR